MKKTLSFVLALLMVLGCMSVTAFAADNDSWSYDATTDTITVNLEVPTSVPLGSAAPFPTSLEGEFKLPASDEGISYVSYAWVKQSDTPTYVYNEKNWEPAISRQFVAGTSYGYAVQVVYSSKDVDHSNAKIVLNGKTYTNPGNGNSESAINYMPFIVVDLGVLNENGSFSGGDFAEPEEDGKSGTTTLTATKAEPFSYKISIPTKVDAITAAGVYPVGEAAKAIDVKGATEKTVISYTATTTAFKLSTDESKTLAATYHSDAEGTTAFPTTAVTVYENKADAASLPTMYVKIADTDWNAAAAGTYTATVTYNFSAEEVEAKTVSLADVMIKDAECKLSFLAAGYSNNEITYKKTETGFEGIKAIDNGNDVSSYFGGMYLAQVVDDNTIKVGVQTNFAVIISISTSTYTVEDLSGGTASFEFTGFSVKPAGAEEFTEITLTPASV